MTNEPKSADFSDSYISIILGFLVVLVGAILVYNFFRHSNSPQINTVAPTLIAKNLSPTEAQYIPTRPPENKITLVPTKVKPTSTPTITVAPTTKPTLQPTKAQPTSIPTVTVKPTIKPTLKPTLEPSKAPTIVVTQAPAQKGETVHTVKTGDTLWSIAEKYYGSGYNWVTIAKANNITNPGMIFNDNKLTIPKAEKIEPKGTIAKGEITPSAVSTTKSYTVVKGDSLWTIAVQVYGNGEAWTKIAEANHLSNPRLIYAGNTLSIP